MQYVSPKMPTVLTPKAPSTNAAGCRKEVGSSGIEIDHSPRGRAARSCRGYPDHAPTWAFCPVTSTFSLSPGRVSAGHRTTTLITPQMVQKFARTARARIRIDGSSYRRDHLRALAQRVEVADREVRIIGSKSNLLQTLTAARGIKSVTPGVRGSVLKWRKGCPP